MFVFCKTNLIVDLLWHEFYVCILLHESYCLYCLERTLLAGQAASWDVLTKVLVRSSFGRKRKGIQRVSPSPAIALGL